ncbi:hypothetical protein C0J52_20739 [Blattella germanica]|nr:hypothetical protein C0J52_20739 [Blattella germanica]
MSQCTVLVVFSILFGVTYAALPLPSFVKACSFNDPNLNECAKKSAIAAIPEFVKGNAKYRIPSVDPLAIESMHIQQGTGSVGLTLDSRNCLMHGLKNVDVQAIRIDPIKYHTEYDWFFPQITMKCDYNVKGRVLLLPIQGEGKSIYVLNNVIGNYTYDYDLIKKEDNLEYAVPKNPKLVFKTQELKINLENLFNGNKFLGDNMNTILNDNWEELMKDMGPAFSKALGDFINQCLTNVYDLVPYEVATTAA